MMKLYMDILDASLDVCQVFFNFKAILLILQYGVQEKLVTSIEDSKRKNLNCFSFCSRRILVENLTLINDCALLKGQLDKVFLLNWDLSHYSNVKNYPNVKD